MVYSDLEIQLFGCIYDQLLLIEGLDTFWCQLNEALDLDGSVDLRDLLEQASDHDFFDSWNILHVVLGDEVLIGFNEVEAFTDAFTQLQWMELDLNCVKTKIFENNSLSKTCAKDDIPRATCTILSSPDRHAE